MEATKAGVRVSFRSKIDTWVVVLLLAAFVFTVVRAIGQIEVGASPGGVLLAFAPVFAYCAIIAAVGLPTRYDLTPTALVVRSGVLRYLVSYDEILDVEPTRSPLAAPAWSLDRLKIGKKRGYLLVSPADKEGFIEALRVRAPQMRTAQRP